ncbi:MAG: ubiquitin-like small modifier protein 1 [Chloroflexota bacterium]
MATIRIPPVLRSQAGGQRQVEIEGGTVGQTLRNLTVQFPALSRQIFDDGQLQPYVNVYLNDQDIQYMQQLDTPASAGDTITILPAMAGGFE